MLKRFFCSLIIAALLTCTPARAEDWPEFRGPTGQGQATGSLPSEWSPTKNVTWKQAIPGSGWSSPIVCGGRLFLTTGVPAASNSKAEVSLRVLALEVGTGKIVWDKEVFRQPTPRIQNKNSHASPT